MTVSEIVNAHLTLQALFAYHDIPLPPCFQALNDDGAKIGRWCRDNDVQPTPVEPIDDAATMTFSRPPEPIDDAPGPHYRVAGRLLWVRQDEVKDVTDPKDRFQPKAAPYEMPYAHLGDGRYQHGGRFFQAWGPCMVEVAP